MKFRRSTLAVSLSAAVLLVGAPAAMALSHTDVTVGGSATPAGPVAVTGANVGSIDFESNFGVPMDCQTSSIDGFVNRGQSVAIGETVGEIDELVFEDCTATGLLYDVNVVLNSGAEFEVRTHPTNAGDPIAVSITGINALVSPVGGGNACRFTATGDVDATILPATTGNNGRVQVSSTDTLTLDAVVGTSSCGGEVQDGDLASMTGLFNLNSLGAGNISHG